MTSNKSAARAVILSASGDVGTKALAAAPPLPRAADTGLLLSELRLLGVPGP